MFVRLFVFALVTLAASAAQSAREHYESGLRAQRAGDLTAARLAYRAALDADPGLFRARHLLAVCELQMGNWEEGVSQLEALRKGDPANLQASQTLVSVYIARGLLDQAREVMNTSLRNDRSAGGHLMRGALLMAEQNHGAAIGELTKARRLNPKLPGLASQLGVAFCFENRFEEALPLLEKALQEYPNDPNAAAFLGWLYKERGREADAAALLAKTVATRPEDTGALFLLAQLTKNQGKTSEALAMLESVVAKEPDHRGAHVLLARLYLQLRRPADAERERQIVERLNREQQAAQPKAP